MSNERQIKAHNAAEYIRSCENFPDLHNRQPIGLILGTGWSIPKEAEKLGNIPLETIPGFKALENSDKIEGHQRELTACIIKNQLVIILNGRIHLNEQPGNPEIFKMVRLQTEMLFHLGIKQLIITSAVGSLSDAIEEKNRPKNRINLEVDDVACITKFITLYAGRMPLWSEFVQPTQSISERLINLAKKSADGLLTIKSAIHAMVTGPGFETLEDKKILFNQGADVVGMSMLPENYIASLYKGIEALNLVWVSNMSREKHSHEINLERSAANKSARDKMLIRIIESCNS